MFYIINIILTKSKYITKYLLCDVSLLDAKATSKNLQKMAQLFLSEFLSFIYPWNLHFRNTVLSF